MGQIYHYCDCRNKDTRAKETEKNFLSNLEKMPNKQYFFRNNNNSMKTLSSMSKLTKDSTDINIAVNKIINNYRKYQQKKSQDKLNNIKDETKDNNIKINQKQNNIIINHEQDQENEIRNNYNSHYSNDSNLRKKKGLDKKITNYIGKRNEKGLKEGFGKTKWNNDSQFIGIYKDNKAEGFGIFINGIDSYKGEFQNDSANGFGIYQHGDEIIYIGYWIDDLEENIGIEKWKDGSIYEGEYSKGKKHGIGTYIWNDGCKYEGNWNNNTREGYGLMYYNKQKVYIGEWKNNLREGFGELIFSNKKYIGFFSKNNKDGFGICYWNLVNKAFIGFWKNGKQSGFGKFMTRNKRRYGIWSIDNQVNWFKNEDEAMEFLESQGLKSYKKLLLFSLDDIRNYSINNDDYNELLD